MTPKEKAKSILEQMSSQTYEYQPYAGARYLEKEVGYEAGKKCALIAVNEILTNIYSKYNGYYVMPEDVKKDYDFWDAVKEEIISLKK
jgi:hypothetical protein